jgi:glycosyltransferase involved in cell wall biosynthesis
MVGPVGNVQGKEHLIAELSTLPNVHFLGLKAVDELASYGQYLDVCLMCYELNDYTRYIYPLKLHEYLASGRPIVASAIPAIVEHSDVVTIAHGDEQWLAGVQRALEPRSSAKTAAEVRRARARQYDWDALAGHVADLINERLAARDSAIRPRAQDPSVG